MNKYSFILFYLYFNFFQSKLLYQVNNYLGSRRFYQSIDSSFFQSQLNYPNSISYSFNQNFLLFIDSGSNTIRYINLTDNKKYITTIAGGYGYSNGIGTNALFSDPEVIITSPDNTYALIIEYFRNIIRKIILSTNLVTTFVGYPSLSGDTDAIGTNSRFYYPSGITISTNGLFALVTDSGNNLIRKIVLSTASVTTFSGRYAQMPTDGIGTNAAFFTPISMSISPDNTYALIVESVGRLIRKIIISTTLVTTIVGRYLQSAIYQDGVGTNALLYNPQGITISPSGIYALITEPNANTIRQLIISTLTITTLCGSLTMIPGFANGIGTNALFYRPMSVSISNNDDIVVADLGSNLIRHITLSTAMVTTFLGHPLITPEVGTNAFFEGPSTPVISNDNTFILIPDSISIIRYVNISTELVTSIAGSGVNLVKDGIGTNSFTAYPASLCLSIDQTFALFTSDYLVRKLIISTSEVITIAGNQSIAGYLDGQGLSAIFNSPSGIAISPDLNYALITDTFNNLIRLLDLQSYYVSTFAGTLDSGYIDGSGTNAKFSFPNSIIISSDGSYALVTDASNNLIRKINLLDSEVTTFAGDISKSYQSINGIGSNAAFNSPHSICFSSDNTYVFVGEYNSIRKIIISTIEVTTIAGGLDIGTSNGVGTNALFNYLNGVAISPDNTYAIITEARSVRKINLVESKYIAWFPLDGNGIDITNNINSSILINVSPTTNRFGESNKALYFERFSYIQIGDIAVQGNSARSHFLWMKTINTNGQCMLSSGNPVQDGTFNLVMNYGGSTTLGLMGFGNDIYPYSGPIIYDGEWHHVGAVYDGTYLILYVDGVKSLDPIEILYNTIGQDNYIGKSNHLGYEYFFQGSLDDVRIYPKALNSSQVWSLFLHESDTQIIGAPFPYLSIVIIYPNNLNVDVVGYGFDEYCKFYLIFLF